LILLSINSQQSFKDQYKEQTQMAVMINKDLHSLKVLLSLYLLHQM